MNRFCHTGCTHTYTGSPLFHRCFNFELYGTITIIIVNAKRVQVDFQWGTSINLQDQKTLLHHLHTRNDFSLEVYIKIQKEITNQKYAAYLYSYYQLILAPNFDNMEIHVLPTVMANYCFAISDESVHLKLKINCIFSKKKGYL